MIAFSCTAALVSAISGVIVSKYKSYKEMFIGAWVLMVRSQSVTGTDGARCSGLVC